MAMIRASEMELPRCRMAWREAGAGWPVVLLHAFPLTGEMWRPQLERVPDGWRFIAPDLRGFGHSSGPLASGSGGPLTMDDYAADVGDLLDALRIDQAVIAGLSMGGYIAFAMHHQAPARLAGLVLADTRAQADTPDGRALRVRLRETLARSGVAAVADQMLPKSLSDRAEPVLVAQVRAVIEAEDPAAIDAALVAMMARRDATPDLPRIGCATLVVAGELDAIVPIAETEAMQRAIPRAALAVISGAGHLASLEQPESFSKALADFLLARL